LAAHLLVVFRFVKLQCHQKSQLAGTSKKVVSSSRFALLYSLYFRGDSRCIFRFNQAQRAVRLHNAFQPVAVCRAMYANNNSNQYEYGMSLCILAPLQLGKTVTSTYRCQL